MRSVTVCLRPATWAMATFCTAAARLEPASANFRWWTLECRSSIGVILAPSRNARQWRQMSSRADMPKRCSGVAQRVSWASWSSVRGSAICGVLFCLLSRATGYRTGPAGRPSPSIEARRSAAPARHFVKRDRRRVGDVEAGECRICRQAYHQIATIAGQSPEAGSFCPQNQRDAAAEIGLVEPILGILLEPHAPEAGVLEGVQGAGEV